MIAELRKLAIDKGGQCLSNEYINNHTKMRWRCHKGHEWQASAANVKGKKSWCPTCAGNTRLNLEIMHAAAAKQGGKCLSTEYKNAQTKLKWQCVKGHVWLSTYGNVSSGKWCLECVGRKKYTIEDMYHLTARYGGRCLSTQYKNSQSKLEWLCKLGHSWKTSAANVISGTWCPTCAGNKRLSIEQVIRMVEDKGGRLLSKEYINLNSIIKIECAKGHTWTTSVNSIKHSHNWCPECAGNKRLTIEAMDIIAKENEGRCLSKKYFNNSTKLLWECKFGHTWEATPQSIRNLKTWCPDCAGRHNITLEKLQLIALERRGKCLEESYHNGKIGLKWECELGHEFQATAEKVIHRKQWCPICAGNVKLTLHDMKNLAASRNGKCLSTEYVNSQSNLIWQCEFGHNWEATASNIKRGKWCPDCSGSRGESAIRAFLEKIFSSKFPKKRPLWLKRGKSRFELDGYCEELGIAFEYHGNYHFDEKHNWYPGSLTLQQRIEYDAFKRARCKTNNVYLIEISEFDAHDSDAEKKQKVIDAILNCGLTLPQICTSTSFGQEIWFASQNLYQEASTLAAAKEGKCLSKMIQNTTQKIVWQCKHDHIWEAALYTIRQGHWCLNCAGKARSTIAEMQEIAKAKDGKCLSPDYVNARTKLLWQCKQGHQWLAVPYSVKNQGTWCPECSGTKRLDISIMQGIAKKKGGLCLSTEYINGNIKLEWACKSGHKWKASYASANATWCPTCSGRNYITIEKLQSIALERGGKCLEESYLNGKIQMKWVCKLGHDFKATAAKVIYRKQWCPICAGRNKLTIEQMHEIAKARNGKCLSKDYVNAGTKLHWQCHRGHQWFAAPYSVKSQGSWCKECHRLNKSSGVSDNLIVEKKRAFGN